VVVDFGHMLGLFKWNWMLFYSMCYVGVCVANSRGSENNTSKAILNSNSFSSPAGAGNINVPSVLLIIQSRTMGGVSGGKRTHIFYLSKSINTAIETLCYK